jgi:hypothetical protein
LDAMASARLAGARTLRLILIPKAPLAKLKLSL